MFNRSGLLILIAVILVGWGGATYVSRENREEQPPLDQYPTEAVAPTDAAPSDAAPSAEDAAPPAEGEAPTAEPAPAP